MKNLEDYCLAGKGALHGEWLSISNRNAAKLSGSEAFLEVRVHHACSDDGNDND